jgi:hypothetical protein
LSPRGARTSRASGQRTAGGRASATAETSATNGLEAKLAEFAATSAPEGADPEDIDKYKARIFLAQFANAEGKKAASSTQTLATW